MEVTVLQQAEWVDGVAKLLDEYRYVCKDSDGNMLCHFDSDRILNKEEIKTRITELIHNKEEH